MIRIIPLAAIMFLAICGCAKAPSSTPVPQRDIPADRTILHPWFAELLDQDTATVAAAIQKRISADASPEMAPLINHVAKFAPHRMIYSQGNGYILCIKQTSRGKAAFGASDFLYIAQPLPDDVVATRVDYFDESIRPLMREFISKFAGCGEQMEGFAGQFALNQYTKAVDRAYHEPEKLKEWKETMSIYSAQNGDSVFINSKGATAWHVFETNETIPLFGSFPDFIKHFAEFRQTDDTFDSWASRDFLGMKR